MSQYQKIIIGHKVPTFDISADDIFLGGDAPPTARQLVLVGDDDMGASYDGRVIAEYFYLFYFFLSGRLPAPETDFYYVIQYRKFLSRDPNAPSPAAMPYLLTCPASAVPERDLPREYLEDLCRNSKEACGPILQIGNLAKNYSKYHEVEDFCGFLSAMTMCGCFTRSEIKEFVYFPYLIPSPSVGLLKTSHLLDDLRLLSSVWMIFFGSFYTARSGYQRRVGGYLLERLHSFLMLKRLMKTNFKDVEICPQYVVSEDGSATANY
jgi:hypothetical protein